MTSRSRRLSEEDLEKVPGHCSFENEMVPECYDGRKISAFIEDFPLRHELKVTIDWSWERACFKVLIAQENELILEAERIKEDAVKVFERARKYDNRSTPNLGITVRVRADTFGPRINWVKFVGKGRTGLLGQTQHYTKPVPLAGKFSTSKKTFAAFSVDIQEDLVALEDRAAVVRYQVEKLTRLKKLLFEPPCPS